METDFWKEKLNFYQRKNMKKKDGLRISYEDALKEINSFKKNRPEIITNFEDSGSYISWEAFVSSEIKLRFYLQSQVKLSFMQKIDGIFTKVADAKFPYNPFPEINDFFDHYKEILAEYGDEKINTKRSSMQQKITYEFIKALLKSKFDEKKYRVECNENDFTLIVEDKTYTLNSENFRQIISGL